MKSGSRRIPPLGSGRRPTRAAASGPGAGPVVCQEAGASRSAAKWGGVDVGAIAAAEGGGGHHNAAGFTTADDPDVVIERIRAKLRG